MRCGFETQQRIGKLILFRELRWMSSVLPKFGVIQSTQLWELDRTKLHLENVTGKLVASSVAQLRIDRFRFSLVQSLITWHPMYFSGDQDQMFKGQGHTVKTSSESPNYWSVLGNRVTESNGVVRISVEAGKWHYVHVQYKFLQKQLRTTAATLGAFKAKLHALQFPPFLVFSIFYYSVMFVL